MRGMYAKLALKTKSGKPLKDYHHINLGAHFLQDCQTWMVFLTSQSRMEISRPFVDLSETDCLARNKTLEFYSDASRNESLGMGAIFDN